MKTATYYWILLDGGWTPAFRRLDGRWDVEAYLVPIHDNEVVEVGPELIPPGRAPAQPKENEDMAARKNPALDAFLSDVRAAVNGATGLFVNDTPAQWVERVRLAAHGQQTNSPDQPLPHTSAVGIAAHAFLAQRTENDK